MLKMLNPSVRQSRSWRLVLAGAGLMLFSACGYQWVGAIVAAAQGCPDGLRRAIYQS